MRPSIWSLEAGALAGGDRPPAPGVARAIPAEQRRAFVDVALPVDEVVRLASRELESVINGSGAPLAGAWDGVAKPEAWQ